MSNSFDTDSNLHSLESPASRQESGHRLSTVNKARKSLVEKTGASLGSNFRATPAQVRATMGNSGDNDLETQPMMAKDTPEIRERKADLAEQLATSPFETTMRTFTYLLLAIFIVLELMLVANPSDIYTLSTVEQDGKRVVLPPQPGLVPEMKCFPEWKMCPSKPHCQYGPLMWSGAGPDGW